MDAEEEGEAGRGRKYSIEGDNPRKIEGEIGRGDVTSSYGGVEEVKVAMLIDLGGRGL